MSYRRVFKLLVGLTIVPLLRVLGYAAFDRKWLRGRHFAPGCLTGWRWVWRSLWTQKLLGFNRRIPWPVSPLIVVSAPHNLEFDPDDLNNFQTFGCYFQNFAAKITIGKGTYIAPNVGIITANHDPENPERHLPGAEVVIGCSCWIGMNAVVLPGITLGDQTVVGAGAVVTRSFPRGHCVLAGVPARAIRHFGEGLEEGSPEATE